jgi:hypothetical protein
VVATSVAKGGVGAVPVADDKLWVPGGEKAAVPAEPLPIDGGPAEPLPTDGVSSAEGEGCVVASEDAVARVAASPLPLPSADVVDSCARRAL